ncbi:MAG: hypothetical protein IJ867_07610 [Clostridia bacterium]|nr:hypothetical protein [Clostridia bacterium]
MKIINKVASSIVIASLLTYYASPVLAYVNEETIYSNLDANGKAYNSTVTTVVEDKKGTTTSQDTTKNELPIETKITYYLDGEEMEASKIAGKSGRVTIKLEFENKEKHGDIYTPFVVVAGLMIDNKANTNIEIVNGKLLTNGNSTIAVGIALPGMQESLGIDEDTFQIPSSVEIAMDTEKFESGNIMVYASPKLLGSLDISMKDFDEIFDQVDALETAAKALEDGAVTLADGMKTLDAGAVQLSSGAKELNDGANQLKEGANSLANGAQTLSSEYGALDTGIASLKSGVDTLSNGSSALDSGAGALVSGIGQVSDGATSLSAGIGQVSGGANALVGGISQVDGGINQLISGIEENVDVSTFEAQKETLKGQMNTYQTMLGEIPADETLEAGLAAEVLTEEQVANYKQTRSLLAGLVQSLEANYSSLVATEQLYGGLLQVRNGIEKEDGLLVGANALVAGIGQVDAGATSLAQGIDQVSAGASSLKSGTESLVSGVSDLSSGASSLKAGSNKVVNGLSELSAGSVALKNGANSLSDGATTLYNGTVSLAEGTVQLVTGSETLSNGMKQFNRDGISKIADLVNKDGKDLIRKIEKLEKLSNDYTSFASKEERDDLKFISITDSIKVEEKASDSKSNKNSKSKK